MSVIVKGAKESRTQATRKGARNFTLAQRSGVMAYQKDADQEIRRHSNSLSVLEFAP